MKGYEEKEVKNSQLDAKKELFDLIKEGYMAAEEGRVNSLEEVREIFNKKREKCG